MSTKTRETFGEKRMKIIFFQFEKCFTYDNFCLIHHFRPHNPKEILFKNLCSMIECWNLTWIPSQTTFNGTHWFFVWQENSFDEHDRAFGQSLQKKNQFIFLFNREREKLDDLPSSSDENESRQSLMPLQSQIFGIQRLVTRQWYSFDVQLIKGFLCVHCSSIAWRQSMTPSQTDDLFR